MTPLSTVTSIVAPLPRDNVDTDAIIPSREMKSTGRTGLAEGLFAPWRYTNVATRLPDPEFVLNRPEFADTRILSSGKNFGCGSSREHAVWALSEWGIRVILAESFAPIFQQNCLRNGLLPVALEHAVLESLAGQEVTVDLAEQVVSMGAQRWPFVVDEEARIMLLEGLDAIDLTLKSHEAIEDWTSRDRQIRPWVYLEQAL